MPNVELSGREEISPFRKIALGTWQTEYDPQIYGTMRLRMDESLRYIERFRERYGKKLTITHLVAKALGIALHRCPDANAILRWNSVYRRKTVDVSILVLMEENGKADLSAAKVTRIDEKSLVDIVTELDERAARIRARQDKDLEQTRQSMQLVPAILMNALMKLLSFLLYTLNLDLSRFGLPKDPLGGAIVTSIGSLGLEVGYVPLGTVLPGADLFGAGSGELEPVVEGDRVVIGQMININATFDHRIVDGAHAAVMSRAFREVLEKPFEYLDPV